MTPHTEHAASTAAQSVEWGTWLRSAAGTGATITASQVNDWVTLCAGLLTAVYTVLKIIEWFDARSARAQQTQSLERLHELWERRALERTTRAAALDDQSHHAGK